MTNMLLLYGSGSAAVALLSPLCVAIAVYPRLHAMMASMPCCVLAERAREGIMPSAMYYTAWPGLLTPLLKSNLKV